MSNVVICRMSYRFISRMARRMKIVSEHLRLIFCTWKYFVQIIFKNLDDTDTDKSIYDTKYPDTA